MNEIMFNEFYQKYHRDLFQFIFYMAKDHELTEDLVQEVYIRVLRSYHQFEGKSSEKTWLFSIARNTAIDYFRKQKSLKRLIIENIDLQTCQLRDDQPLPEEIALERDEIEQVFVCMERCTNDQRKAIILRYIHDCSITETARILGWSESKVKSSQHRALQILKKYFREYQQEPPCLASAQ